MAMPTNLAGVPFCDLVDMVARLAASTMVAEMLARSGFADADHEKAMQVWKTYMDVLKAEGDQRFAEMRAAAYAEAVTNAEKR